MFFLFCFVFVYNEKKRVRLDEKGTHIICFVHCFGEYSCFVFQAKQFIFIASVITNLILFDEFKRSVQEYKNEVYTERKI